MLAKRIELVRKPATVLRAVENGGAGVLSRRLKMAARTSVTL